MVASAAALAISSAGCSTLGPMGRWVAGGGERALTPPAAVLALADSLPTPGFDVFRVVAWGLAIVLGSLVLAFVAKLLNGRAPFRSAPAGALERIPATAVPGRTTES